MNKALTTHITAKNVLAYMLLPQLGRRIKNLSINTQWIALLLVSIFEVLRLLPVGHAYTSTSNIPNITIRGVLTLAGQNLKFDWRHTDQIIIYGVILLGFILLIAQFALIAFVLTTNVAHAQFMGYFQPPAGLDLSKDIAFSMMDQVFGVPGLYGTAYDPAVTGSIPPFTQALQLTFAYYNNAISVVAAFLVGYFLFVVLIETIQDGTPFGKRFASGYVPLRLIIAMAFLVPTYHGYSTGQHLVLHVAKWGGSFATNSWIAFAAKVENPLGEGSGRMLPVPQYPNTNAFNEALILARVCAAYHRVQYNKQYEADGLYFTEPLLSTTSGGSILVAGNGPDAGGLPRPINLFMIYDEVLMDNKPVIMADVPAQPVTYYTNLSGGATTITDYDSLLQATQNKVLRLRFGQIHPDIKGFIRAENDGGFSPPVVGSIEPTCGEIIIPATPNSGLGVPTMAQAAGQAKIFNLIGLQLGWYNDMGFAYRLLAIKGLIDGVKGCDIPVGFSASWPKCNEYPPAQYWADIFQQLNGTMKALYASAAVVAQTEMQEKLSLNNAGNIANNELFTYGWAGAGMWYNRISDTYSTYTSIFQAPVVKSYPMILNDVAKAKRTQQPNAKGKDLFTPELPDGGVIQLDNPNDLKYAELLAHVIFSLTAANSNAQDQREDNSNSFVSFINIIFGLEGIFNLRENGDVHPFGQLVAAGKGLIDSSIAAFTGTIFATGISGFLSAIGSESGSKIGQMAAAMASMASTIGLSAGIIMFYVIPMTPFMYFFLAAGRWVKSIFEAMIGVPLWAMAHIRIDGTGLPGVAGNGYFLVFEIFLRPVLTLFGLLASMATYGALMTVFNDIFDLVVDNLGNNDIGSTPDPDYIDEFRGTVDMFFYTILYAIIAYMMAMSSFKLIDLIPDSILRWMGAGVKSFGDESGNIAEGLNRTISIQGMMTAQKVSGIAEGVGGAAGSGAGGIARMMGRKP
tara:strand:+ start:292761 stop:295661 length:2901 start_codon:yes stop_codon:yes gene_type:complete